MEITNNLYLWLQNYVFSHLPFKGKFHKWSGALRTPNYDERFIFIQAGNAFGTHLHYEFYQSRWEFHIEIEDKAEKEAFINWIKERIPDNDWFKWKEWKNNSWRYQHEQQIDTVERLASVLYELYGVVEPHINYYEQLQCQNDAQDVEEIVKEMQEECVEFKSELLDEIFNRELTIPDYQRIYCWEKENVLQLLNDITDIKTSAYNMGNIILHKRNENEFDIVDGQQRLVTLSIIIFSIKERIQDLKLPTLLECKFMSDNALQHVHDNYETIKEYLREHSILSNNVSDNESIDSFVEKLKKLKFGVLVIGQNYLDLAFTFFSNTNSKGKKLSDYDLLKPHHLRYIPSDYVEQQQMYADQWDSMLGKEKDKTDSKDRSLRRDADYVRVLELYLYRLRKWCSHSYCANDSSRFVYQEYKTDDIIDEIPPFGERFDFFEPIQGGQHFFEYVNRFLSEFKEFRGGKDDTGRPYQVIHKYLCGYSDRWYAYVMEALLFCYYLKFGTSYLNEAALTIVRYISQIRFEKGRAYEPTILEYAGNSGIVPIILQSSSPTFFLAKMESKIKRFSSVDISNGNVRKWFKISCKNISSEIEKNCITNYFKNYYKSHYGNITSK